MKIFENVAALEAATLTAGQFVDTYGYYSKGDGGQARYLIQTAADYGATPDGYIDHELANGNVAVLQHEGTILAKQAGAVGDNTTDDYAALQNFADLGHTNDTINFILDFGVATYRLTSALNLRRCQVDAQGATFNGDHEGIVLLLGGRAQNGNNPQQNVFRAYRSQGTDDADTPTVRIIGAKVQQIEVESAPYIQLFASATDSNLDGSIAYSRFKFKAIDTLELTTDDSYVGTDPQWINENYFDLERVYNLYINGSYAHNKNIFYGGVFEGTAEINIDVGTCNQLNDVRFENFTGPITFGTATAGNIIRVAWFSGYNLGSGTDNIPSNIVNNGRMNIVHSYLDARPWKYLAGFSFSSLLQDGSGNYNVLGAANLTIGTNNFSSTGPWRTVYESTLIPVTPLMSHFNAYVRGKTAGGVRIIVDGYDSTQTLITPADGDLVYFGGSTTQFGASHASVNDAGGISFMITNEDCAYIVVKYYVGGVALTAETLNLIVRDSEYDPRDSFIQESSIGKNNFI